MTTVERTSKRNPKRTRAEAIAALPGVAESFGRRRKLESLLDGIDWKAAGFKDRWEWLSAQYGPGHKTDLLIKCQQQLEAEDLL